MDPELVELHNELAADLDRIRQRFGPMAPYLTLIVRPPDRSRAIAMLQTEDESFDAAMNAATELRVSLQATDRTGGAE